MWGLGRGKLAGVLGVLSVLGAVALVAVAQPHAASAPESAKGRLAVGPGDVPRPVPTPERPHLVPDEPPGPPEPRREIPSSGPTTRGAVIRVAGREVQLPPDAYIELSVAAVLCVEGRPCPEAPYFVLRRGGSTVSVSLRSGARFAEQIAPGEEGAFDFLPEAARLGRRRLAALSPRLPEMRVVPPPVGLPSVASVASCSCAGAGGTTIAWKPGSCRDRNFFA